MNIIRDVSEFPGDGGAALSIGNFDGVHAGHRILIQQLCESARRLNVPAVVFTFDPHPLALLNPDGFLPKLNDVPRKAELLGACGVDYLIAYPTDFDLLELTYQSFFEAIVVRQIQAKAMVEGPNFFFGKNREGDIPKLKQLCISHQIDLTVVPLERNGGQEVSSSVIRRCLWNGDIDAANRLLTVPYRISGKVESGAQRGRELGFPTANLHEIETLLPADGVYGGWVLYNGERLPSAIHIGPNPTFDDQRRKTEVHILDHSLDLYGQRLIVDFEFRVRGLVKFSSKNELVQQLVSDTTLIRNHLTENRR